MAIILYLHDNRWCIHEFDRTSGRISKFIESENVQGFEWRFLINKYFIFNFIQAMPVTQKISCKSSSNRHKQDLFYTI